MSRLDWSVVRPTSPHRHACPWFKRPPKFAKGYILFKLDSLGQFQLVAGSRRGSIVNTRNDLVGAAGACYRNLRGRQVETGTDDVDFNMVQLQAAGGNCSPTILLFNGHLRMRRPQHPARVQQNCASLQQQQNRASPPTEWRPPDARRSKTIRRYRMRWSGGEYPPPRSFLLSLLSSPPFLPSLSFSLAGIVNHLPFTARLK